MTVVGPVERLPLKEFRRLDRNSEDLGVPVQRLMANAGKALADAIVATRKDRHVVLLCGKGDNGGDGFAAAGLLERWNIPYTVVLLEPGEVRDSAAQTFLGLLPTQKVVPWKGSRRSAWDGALVVDCMLGSGIRGAPRPPYNAAIKWANQRTVIACDVPSGLGTSTAIRPKATITFHAAKEGMTAANSGKIIVAPIGIPKAAETDIGRGDLDAGFVRPGAEAHKGDQGRVLVVGGGPFTGAPYFAGMGAARAGADLVHVAAPADAAAVIHTWGPDLMVHDACHGRMLSDEASPVVQDLLRRVDTLVIGPGLGHDAGAREAARACIDMAGRAKRSIVVDADGLDAVDDDLLEAHGQRMVLTPHGQEFKDLSGWRPTQANVTKYAREHGVTVLRKAAVDVVAGPLATRVCRHGHPGMTVGGTGDVLAGIVGAFMARGAAPFDAACAAAYTNGVAGELAAGMRSYGMLARDVVEAIPVALARLE